MVNLEPTTIGRDIIRMEKMLHILIIEDSESDSLLIERMIRKAGYKVFTKRVDTAFAVQNALDSWSWDIVISDYSMPSFSGSEALTLVQASGHDLPFIMVSGVMGEDTAVAAMRAGAHDYMMKDNLNRLIPAIEREMREASQRQARRDAENQVRILSRALSQSSSLVLIANIEGMIIFVNQAFTNITDYSPDEAVGQSWMILSTQTIFSDQITSLESAILAKEEWHGEIEIQKKSGIYLWVLLSLSPIRDDMGEVIQYLFVAEDITNRKKLEAEIQRYNDQLEQMVEERTQQLQQSKEETEVILNATSDAIALALPTGDIQKTNRAFRELFGDNLDQAIEQLLWVVADESSLESVAESFLSVMYDDESKRVEALIETTNTQSIDADLMFAPVAQATADRSGLVLSLRDISYLKEFERFKTDFIANATHDLANPLAAMRVRLFILQKSPERLNEHVNHIEHQIERLEYLISELRTLSELDRGKITLQLGELDINKLVTQIAAAQQPMADEKQQQLQLNIDPDLPLILADRHRIDRMIVNLVSNAINYTPRGGQVTVQTLATPNHVTLLVQDTGIGIAEENLPHIFERFYRTARAQSSSSTGTGLGLAIAKEIVELHNGTIEVTSQVNIGTRFVVELPTG